MKTEALERFYRRLAMNVDALPASKDEIKKKIKQIQKRKSVLRDRRDKEVQSILDKYSPTLHSLNEALANERKSLRELNRRPSALQRYAEESNAPLRHCKGCGSELLHATVENVVRVKAAYAFRSDSDRDLEECSWQDLRKLRKDYCCYWCEREPGSHSKYCSSVDEIKDAELAMNQTEEMATA